jgi:hypothetical protein
MYYAYGVCVIKGAVPIIMKPDDDFPWMGTRL